MSTLYLLVGPPGVGKTCYCRERIDDRDVRVSMDDITGMMGAYRIELRPIYKEAEKLIILSALKDGRDVWLDRTNMDKKRRVGYVEMLREVKPKRIIVLNFMPAVVHRFPVEINRITFLLSRRIKDQRGVSQEQWRKVIRDMLSSYEEPTTDEGVDKIVNVPLEDIWPQ